MLLYSVNGGKESIQLRTSLRIIIDIIAWNSTIIDEGFL